MPTKKIDFAAIRAQLSFEAVLMHYNVDGKAKGEEQWQGYCPLPSHVHKGESGKPRSPSFSVNLSRGIFQCFGCGTKGNVLEFVVRMEGFNPEIGEQFRQGAIRAQELFLGNTVAVGRAQVSAAKLTTPPEEEMARPDDVVNAPLDFSLQGLDGNHPYLKARGFTDKTIAHFGLGFAQRGLMKDRIAIPLKDPNGQLVGYAGRLVDDSAINEDNPKYRFPGNRERDGKQFVFKKSELLYHPDDLRGSRSKYLLVVEGFPSVWWLWQHDVRPVVAVMGASISERQAELVCALTTVNARILIIADGDLAGARLAAAAISLFAEHRFVRVLNLQGGLQPTDFDSDALAYVRSLVT